MKVNLNETQQRRSYTSKQLRRARRLYFRMVYNAHGVQKIYLVQAAHRAQQRGLYSEKTQLKHVYFGVCRYIYKLNRNRDWHAFMRKYRLWPMGHGDNHYRRRWKRGLI